MSLEVVEVKYMTQEQYRQWCLDEYQRGGEFRSYVEGWLAGVDACGYMSDQEFGDMLVCLHGQIRRKLKAEIPPPSLTLIQ